MRSLRTLSLVAIVAVTGGVASLVVGFVMGMPGSELLHLAAYLLPAAVATIAAATLAGPLLDRAPLRQRFVAVAVVSAAVSITNVVVLAMLMFVEEHDATLVAVLLLFAIGAGVAAALVVARRAGDAIRSVETTARRLGTGDLDARTGPVDAGPELDTLAATLDEMADRLRRAQEREGEADRMRRDLITTVSHDLRTPLASLRAMTEAIEDSVIDDPPTLRRYMAEMRRSVGQLGAMVDDLFELTQLDAGVIVSDGRRSPLGELVDEAMSSVELQARDKGVTVVSDLTGTGEAMCSPRVVRVLQNLLVNAVRHTPADGTIRVEAELIPGRVLIAVEDSGEGLAPEDVPRIFDLFFRADPARSGPGAGLGLALAKRIVEALDGRISAQPGAHAGARFVVE
ncbi:MAG: HAMP domain-containing sensor histidine kinase, partial [Actinomycetota bacterium]